MRCVCGYGRAEIIVGPAQSAQRLATQRLGRLDLTRDHIRILARAAYHVAVTRWRMAVLRSFYPVLRMVGIATVVQSRLSVLKRITP